MSKIAIEHIAMTQAIELHEWLEAKRVEHDLHAVTHTVTAGDYDKDGKYRFRVYVHMHVAGRPSICNCADAANLSDAFDEALAKAVEEASNPAPTCASCGRPHA